MAISKTTRRLSGLLMVLAAALGIALFGEATVRRAAFLLKTNPVAATEVAMAKGAELFAENCASCHGIPGGHADGGIASTAQGVPVFSDLNRPASVLAMRITFGVGEGMPAWDGVLSEHEIWHLVTYVMSFQRDGGGWRPRGN